MSININIIQRNFKLNIIRLKKIYKRSLNDHFSQTYIVKPSTKFDYSNNRETIIYQRKMIFT